MDVSSYSLVMGMVNIRGKPSPLATQKMVSLDNEVNDMESKDILYLRLARQGLIDPADEDAYETVFRAQQPVPAVYFCEPGTPPQLRDRAAFDDVELNRDLREDHTIAKGRFAGGNIAYVYADDLPLYASVYRKPMGVWTEEEEAVHHCLTHMGPLYKEQIAEEIGLKASAVNKALTRLQRAFLVHADHGDSYDEQLWYDFCSLYPEIDLESVDRESALREILTRFIRSMAYTGEGQAKDWSRLPMREIKQAFEKMADEGVVARIEVDGVAQWALHEDMPLLEKKWPSPPSHTHVMHRADYLVKAHESELKKRYSGMEILQYLLIDGVFQGAVTGHWRIGPHDVEDIVVTLPEAEKKKRRDEIIAEVSKYYNPPFSRVLRYDGGLVYRYIGTGSCLLS